MLQILKPKSDQSAEISPWTELVLRNGEIRWGRIFLANEVSALVSVKGKDRYDECFEETRPEYVSFFSWKDGKWEFRQFLGNARGLDVHYRKDRPSVFLQGWFKTGRYDGEHVSWYFDKKAGRLEPTGFEDSGPFYLKGDYLVCQSGFQRLAHDWTNAIYEYRDGKKGRLLVDYAGNDSGGLRFSYRDKQSGKWVQWNFFEDQFGGELTKVRYVQYPEKKDGSGPDYRSEEKSSEGVIMESISEESVFEYLTGLDHSLLEEGWEETLLRRGGFEWIPVRTEGDQMIVQTFQGGRDFEKRMNSQVLDALQGVSPDPLGEKIGRIRKAHVRGIWGDLFGNNHAYALIALNMAEQGELGGDTSLYLLGWDKEWKIVQRLDGVSGSVGADGAETWALRQVVGSKESFLLGDTGFNYASKINSWRFDEEAGRLVSTGWPQNGVPSIAGGFLTLSAVNSAVSGSPVEHRIYRLNGMQIGDEVGKLWMTSPSGLLDAALTVRTGEKEVVWRIRQPAYFRDRHADKYSICRGRDDRSGDFREDAVLTVDWGEQTRESGDLVAFLWWQLTGIDSDSARGLWGNGKVTDANRPQSVTVSGLPEAIRIFSWPKTEGALHP